MGLGAAKAYLHCNIFLGKEVALQLKGITPQKDMLQIAARMTPSPSMQHFPL